MNPQDEQFNERLEQSMRSTTPESYLSERNTAEDFRVDELVDLARRLQAAPPLRVDAGFAETLERRLLRHALMAQQKIAQSSAPRYFWRRYKVTMLTGFCVLLFLLGLGLLVLTTQTTNPANPLNRIKQWMPSSRTASAPVLTSAPFQTPTLNQASRDLQSARSRLQTLLTLTTPAQASSYVQVLSQFDEQLNRAANAINSLSGGSQKTQLIGQLAQLKNEARQKLRGLLHTLTSNASAATTTELGYLGEPIPHVNSASIILPAPPKENATIDLAGSGLLSGAQLLVDGKLLPATGTLQNGHIVFVLVWKSEKHPHSLGVVNPDGTVAQTTNVTVMTSTGGNSGNGDGNSGNGNGDNGNGNGGNGNGNGGNGNGNGGNGNGNGGNGNGNGGNGNGNGGNGNGNGDGNSGNGNGNR